MLGKLLSTTALAALVLTAASCSQPIKDNQAQAEKTVQANGAPPMVSPSGQAVTAAPNADRGQLVQEAVAALRETQNALTAIDQNKTGDAIAALERATGKLEIVLARTPDLALAPVDVSVTTQDVLGTIQGVEDARAAVKTAILSAFALTAAS